MYVLLLSDEQKEEVDPMLDEQNEEVDSILDEQKKEEVDSILDLLQFTLNTLVVNLTMIYTLLYS